MAHTNHTTNYELSQFVANDKPTFLGDYNGDMAKIDAAIKAADNKAGAADTTAESAAALATSASTTATEAATDAATAAATATTALNTANNATTTAQNASTAAQSATTTASAAATKADAAKAEAEAATAAVALKPSYDETFARMFSMTSTEVSNSITPASGVTIGSAKVYVAKNTDVSLGKIYGNIGVSLSGVAAGLQKICTIPANLPQIAASYNIAGISGESVGSSGSRVTYGQLTVNTNGTVDVYMEVGSTTNTIYVILPPCLYVLTDFGD